MIVIAVDSLELFSEWMQKVSDFDDSKFIEIGKMKTDKEIVEMIVSGELRDEDIVYLRLSIKRLKSIVDILDRTSNDK